MCLVPSIEEKIRSRLQLLPVHLTIKGETACDFELDQTESVEFFYRKEVVSYHVSLFFFSDSELFL